MQEPNIDLNLAILIAIVSAFLGAFFGSLATLYSENRKEKYLKKKLRYLLVTEIQENVDLLVQAKDSQKSWPIYLLQDLYKNNLGKIHVLPEDWLSAIIIHYKDVQRFEQLMRDVIEDNQDGTRLLPDRAKRALESGEKALEIMN